jgi:ABC-2 type transport system ATP-binding protein
MENAIEVTNLTKHYGNVTAVDGVTFRVARGEFYGLLGPNGAGKTTTIRMLTGLTKPSYGTAKVAGRDCIREPLSVKQRIGVVSEVSNLYNEMSAWDNLMFIGELYGVDKLTRETRARQLLEAFQLYDRGNDRLLGYSKGMKRRVRIAAALLHSPEVLFLDEPTSGLDVQSSRLIRSIIRELNREGVTVFLTTHYIDEADQLCDRVAIIRQGKIVVEGSPGRLKSSLQGEHVLEVAFDRDAPNLQTLIRSRSDVNDVVKHGEKYEIHTSDASVTVAEVAQFARSNGLKIVSLNTKEPSLEDVFVRYTGLDAVQVERMELLRAVKSGGQHG